MDRDTHTRLSCGQFEKNWDPVVRSCYGEGRNIYVRGGEIWEGEFGGAAVCVAMMSMGSFGLV